MDLVASLPAFVLAVVLISASPGPAVALVLRRAAVGGWRSALPTVLGLEAGLYLWALAAAAGFAALVAASEAAFLVLRVVGAVVLLVLGAQALRAAWQERRHAREHGPAARATVGRERSWRHRFGEGLVVQLANPKAAVFMIAFYPQFVPADRDLVTTTALLALLQVALETALYLGLAAAVGRASSWFGRSAVRARLEAVSGTVLVGLGVRVAITSR